MEIGALIHDAAMRYSVNEDHLLKTLTCESDLDSEAVGDEGTSFGIAQIHLPAHPEITKEEAFDPAFSVDYAAKQFSLGNASMWSCWKILFG